MKKTIIITIFIAGLIAIIFFLDWPAYQRMSFLNSEIERHHQFLQQKQELNIKVNQLKQNYEAQKENIKKIGYALPEGKDIPNLIVQFEALASENGLILEGLSFDTKQSEKDSESKKAYKVLNVSLSLTGSYASLKDFLKSSESNVRIMDINSIGFSAVAVERTLETSENMFTFDIELQTYYK